MAAKKKPKAKPAKKAAPAKTKAKPAAPKAKAKPAKPAKAAPVKAGARSAPKPAKMVKAGNPGKSAKPAKLAKPAKTAKPAAKTEKPLESKASSLVKTVKRAASKVAQAAAKAAIKVLEPSGDQTNALAAGDKAPSFELSNEKGERVASSSLSGMPYLLYFYPKDDTPGCTKEACDIRDNFGRFGEQRLKVFGVSPDSQQSHAKFGQKYGLPFSLLSDPEKTLATAYGVWQMKSNYGKKYMGIVRSSFLVGADGVIKKAYRGVRVDGHVSAVLEDAKSLL
jgi:thioredoxin-dependent peroxiredoxin